MSRQGDELDTRKLSETQGAEDGQDPRAFHDRRMQLREQSQGPGRKGLQLGQQVREILTLTLSGCGDDVLRGLTVLQVEPVSNTGRLMVTVAGPEPADVIERHLNVAGAWLRCEVARGITRRKTPELVFRVMGESKQPWSVERFGGFAG